MASEYSLKLKAVLDSTQVKQELENLRNVQKRVLGNENQKVNNSSAPSSANLGSLTSTLNRLNTTMMQMQRTLQHLTGVGRQNISANSQRQMNQGYIPICSSGGFGQSIGKFNENAVRQFFLDSKNLGQHAFERLLASKRGSRIGTFLEQNFGENWERESAIFRRTPTGEQFINQSSPEQIRQKSNMRKLGMFMGGQVFGQSGNLATQLGFNGTGSVLGGIGSGITSGVQTSFMLSEMGLKGKTANLIGAGVGTATGVVDAILSLQKFGEQVQKASEQVNNFSKQVSDSANGLIDGIKNEIKRSDYIRSGDKEQVLSMVNRSASTYQNDLQGLFNAQTQQQKAQERLDIAKEEGGSEFNSVYQSKIEELTKQLEDATNETKSWISKVSNSKNELEQWKSTLTKMNSDTRSFSESMSGIDFKNRFKKAVESQDIATLITLKNAGLQKTSSLEQILGRESNRIVSGKSVSKEGQDALTEYQKELALIEQIDSALKNISEKKKQDAKIESDKLKSIQEQATSQIEAFRMTQKSKSSVAELSRNISIDDIRYKYGFYNEKARTYRGKYTEALENSKNASTSEEARKFIDIANKMGTYMNFAESQRQLYGNAEIERLQNKLNLLVTPDMTNVNSLASQGFAINKSDDEQRLKSQIDYQKEQVNLQRQIRDKILEMNDESQYN